VTRREMMVLIRPTVLQTPVEAAEIVQSERNRMPGIDAAERGFKKDEQELLNKESKELLKREGFKIQ
jgi:type II secretory pathway component GspD/PulD (secretin)